jgi:hypothetical protein
MTFDWINRIQEEFLITKQRTIGPEEAAIEFAKLPAQTREYHLLNLDKSPLTMRQAGLRNRFESAVRRTDSRLRSVGR